MRWPLVWRESLEAAQERAVEAEAREAELRRFLGESQAFVRDYLEQIKTLTQCVVELKQSGHEVLAPSPLPPKTERVPLPAKVLTAIALRSEPFTKERREFETRCADLVKAGVPEDEIERLVLNGQEVEA